VQIFIRTGSDIDGIITLDREDEFNIGDTPVSAG